MLLYIKFVLSTLFLRTKKLRLKTCLNYFLPRNNGKRVLKIFFFFFAFIPMSIQNLKVSVKTCYFKANNQTTVLESTQYLLLTEKKVKKKKSEKLTRMNYFQEKAKKYLETFFNISKSVKNLFDYKFQKYLARSSLSVL